MDANLQSPNSPSNVVYRGTQGCIQLEKEKGSKYAEDKRSSLVAVLLCSRIKGFVTSVTYTQCGPVCSRQSPYKVNNWPFWGHSPSILELPLFAVLLQSQGEADYKSYHFPRLQLHNT